MIEKVEVFAKAESDKTDEVGFQRNYFLWRGEGGGQKSLAKSFVSSSSDADEVMRGFNKSKAIFSLRAFRAVPDASKVRPCFRDGPLPIAIPDPKAVR